jgi:hypothetical protein
MISFSLEAFLGLAMTSLSMFTGLHLSVQHQALASPNHFFLPPVLCFAGSCVGLFRVTGLVSILLLVFSSSYFSVHR